MPLTYDDIPGSWGVYSQGEADALLIAARAQAQANKLLTESINQTLVNYKALERWNGQLPQVSGGSVPFVNVSPAK